MSDLEVAEPIEEPTPEPEVVAAPMPVRSAADGYAMAAVICAIVGFVIPVLPAAAALMLARATEEPHVSEPVSERVARLASTATTLAYISLSLITGFCAAMLLGILAKVLTS